MKDFSRIKSLLGSSTTLPSGTGGAPAWMQQMAHGHHHHEHAADGSCCGHDHSHDHDHAHAHHAHDEAEADQSECEDASPKGRCGCC